MTPGKWRKGTRSGNGGNCVETRTFNHDNAPVEVRDSKAPKLGSLTIDRAEFIARLDSVKLSTTCRSGPPRPGWPLPQSCGTVTGSPPSDRTRLTSLDLLSHNVTGYPGFRYLPSHRKEVPTMTPGNWRKSSRSNAAGGNCVETRTSHHNDAPVEVRDSKAPDCESLAMSRRDFAGLLAAVR